MSYLSDPVDVMHSLLLKSLWLLEGMVYASAFPAASLSSVSFVDFPSFIQPLLFSSGSHAPLFSTLASGLHLLMGFSSPSMSRDPLVLCLTLQPGVHICCLPHGCLKASLIVQGLNAPTFLLKLPFSPIFRDCVAWW